MDRSEKWLDRLAEEYLALIKYVEINKEGDQDWFKLESNKEGTKFSCVYSVSFP